MKITLQLKFAAQIAAKIERAVSKLEGVKSASVNFFTSKLSIEVINGMENEIMEKAAKIAVKTEPQIIVL